MSQSQANNPGAPAGAPPAAAQRNQQQQQAQAAADLGAQAKAAPAQQSPKLDQLLSKQIKQHAQRENAPSPAPAPKEAHAPAAKAAPMGVKGSKGLSPQGVDAQV